MINSNFILIRKKYLNIITIFQFFVIFFSCYKYYIFILFNRDNILDGSKILTQLYFFHSIIRPYFRAMPIFNILNSDGSTFFF